jgi:hypothetical protein
MRASAAAFPPSTPNPGRTAAPRSHSSRTEAYAAADSAGPDEADEPDGAGGKGRGATGHRDSPSMRSGSRLVATILSPGQAASSRPASAAAASMTCSQLSRMSTSSRSASAPASRPAGSQALAGSPGARPITGPRMPSVFSTA